MVTKEEAVAVREVVSFLFKNIGPEKTICFLQAISGYKGNSVKELEAKSEKMTEEEAIAFVLSHGRKNLREPRRTR